MFRKGTASVTTALLFSIVSSPAKAASMGFGEIIVFGNSISDSGNLFNLAGGTFPPSPLYFEGRFSDGPVWIESVSENLGLNPSTFYGNNLTEIGEGLNFAIGGATSGTSTLADTPDVSFPGVTNQVNDFISLLDGNSISEDALIVLWAGENDYVENIRDTGTLLDPNIPVNNITNSLTQLANAGAKNILVPNLVGLSDIPLALDFLPPEQLGVLDVLTDDHNSLLNQAIDSLDNSFSETNFTVFDVNSLLEDIISNPTAFGFNENPATSCLDPNSFPNIDPNVVRCENPDRFIFFDNQHYTNAVHQLIAEDAIQTINQEFDSQAATSVPESRNTFGLIVLGLGMLGPLIKKTTIF